jgi:hypothetical protein
LAAHKFKPIDLLISQGWYITDYKPTERFVINTLMQTFQVLIGVLKNRLVRLRFKYDIYFPVCPSSHDLLRVLDPSKMDYNCTFQGCLSKHPWQGDIKYQPRPLLVPKAKSFPIMIVK